ncbi:MAG: prepilin-type N-terminal cleavage/methylation domain [Chthonomonadaceae bacterium]|nr:prepilin-type N-terminal cleavage/methylation domain [Chthonomonadaceae bacterium]
MKRRPRCRRSHVGFTLIEMIIASILLIVGVSGALGAIGASTRTASYAAEIQTAALLAQRQLAETASQPNSLSSGGDQEGSFDDPYSNYHWKQSVESTDYPKLFKVTVTVTWGPTFHPNQREITTYLRSDQDTITQQLQQNYTSYQNNQTTTSTSSTPGGSSGP